MRVLVASTLAILVVCLAGCGSTPKREDFAVAAAPPGDRALIYVYRDLEGFAGALSSHVRLNDQSVAWLSGNEYTYVYLRNGRYTVADLGDAPPLSFTVEDRDLGKTYLLYLTRRAYGYSASFSGASVTGKSVVPIFEPHTIYSGGWTLAGATYSVGFLQPLHTRSLRIPATADY